MREGDLAHFQEEIMEIGVNVPGIRALYTSRQQSPNKNSTRLLSRWGYDWGSRMDDRQHQREVVQKQEVAGRDSRVRSDNGGEVKHESAPR
jgi:hypothetical protein